MRVKVEVTQKHIDKAVELAKDPVPLSLCYRCPVALALQEKLGNPRWEVGSECAWSDGPLMANLPIRVRSRIHTWDHQKEMEPFEFTLNLEERKWKGVRF